MKLSEFKAWFEGFTEGMEGVPTAAQFDRIKARVAELSEPVAVSNQVRDPVLRSMVGGGIVGQSHGMALGQLNGQHQS